MIADFSAIWCWKSFVEGAFAAIAIAKGASW